MSALSSDLDDPDAQPYFIWDHEITYRELREKLQDEDLDVRLERVACLRGVYLNRLHDPEDPESPAPGR